MTRERLDGIALEVRAAGNGPSVLFLHGFTGRGADWSPFLPAVRASGHRTLVVDLLGHGRSAAPADPAEHAIERQSPRLATLLRRSGAVPAIVVGYSLGARVALRLAATEPDVVRALVLESPSAGIADADARAARRASDDALADAIELDGVAAFVDRWEAIPVFASERRLPERRRARLRRERLRNRPGGLAGALRGAGQGAMEPLHDRLGGIAVPTLVIAGGADATGLERARAVAAGIPDARLVVVPGRGHAVHREAPTTFRHLLIDQLDTWRTSAA
ncbi:MAG: 2-succinyl-6-hydroxy-2,4-cyclohexadiene-1-carboxylate synthase [Candidatus Limnocylindria bacterium]